MSGAIVTSSGDHHRGFHQCPNVLRDKYMPIIGGDGYGFINYLISWANTESTLSVRRMKKDLHWSQDKLERIQGLVLEHCGHIISMTPGDRVTPNQWHLDLETLWAENALHLAQRYAERLATRGVPKSGTQARKASRGVPKSGTEGVPISGTEGVPESGTYKDNDLNTKRKTSSSGSGAAPDARPSSGPDDDDRAAGAETQESMPNPTSLEGPEDLLLFGNDEAQVDGTKLEHATSTEQVPPAAAGLAALQPIPRAVLEARPPRDPERNTTLRALLSASNKSRVEYLRSELAGATRSGIPMALVTRLTDEELERARDAAKADTSDTLSFASAARRAVERLIGEPHTSAGAPRGIEAQVLNAGQAPRTEPEPERPAEAIEVGTRWEHKKIEDKVVTIVDISGGKVELHNGESLLSYLLTRDYRRVD